MRTVLFSILFAFIATGSNAQLVVATFDTLPLSQPDTFYVNYSSPGNNVGFSEGPFHFPCYYDTAWGGLWSGGFSYSNMTDTQTSGSMNQYAAKTGVGYNGSPNYAVFWQGYDNYRISIVPNNNLFKAKGFYITNSSYAYNSMRDGDGFAKKFGGVSGNDPDWFKLTIRGYSGSFLKNDSIEFYLADFRSSNNTLDSILKDWRWVDISVLGSIDSLDFKLTSSDVGSFGMNTPAYFCMDNFTFEQEPMSVKNTSGSFDVKIYPNPATNELFLDLKEYNNTTVTIIDASGKILMTQSLHESHSSIPLDNFSNGMYWLLLEKKGEKAFVHFMKQ